MRRAARYAFSLALIALPLAGAGCGGDEEPEDEGGLTTNLRGIYSIDTWTDNQAGCDVEGASVLEMNTNKKLAIKLDEFLGVDILVAVPCSDAETCANNADAGIFGALLGGSALFDKGSDAAGWDGSGSSHFVNNGMCEGTYFTQRMDVIGDKRVKVETKTFSTTFAPTGAMMDDCPLESAKKAAEGKPCETLAVITATYETTLGEPAK